MSVQMKQLKRDPLSPDSTLSSFRPSSRFILHSLFSLWRLSLCYPPFPPISSTELSLSRFARVQLSHLRCNGHSLLLSSYLHCINLTSSSACDHCDHSSTDLSHLVLHCPKFSSKRFLYLGLSSSLSDLFSNPVLSLIHI